MEWLGRKLYPKARPYERRSRMQVIYLMVCLVAVAALLVAVALWLLNSPTRR